MDDQTYRTISDFWDLLREGIDHLPKRAARDETQWSNELNDDEDKIGFFLGDTKTWLYIKSGESEVSSERTARMRSYSETIRNKMINQKIYDRNAERDGRSIGVQRNWARADRDNWHDVVHWMKLQFEEFKTIVGHEIALEKIGSEIDDSESSLPVYQIATYPADYTLEVLYRKWQNGEIRVPEFQRNFVWKQNQSSRLIESFLVGLPVPAVFLFTVRTSQDYLVIDGQQRLRSVFYFFDGHFDEQVDGEKQPFRLTGLNETSEYSGKTFNALTRNDKKRLKNATLRAFIVMQLDPNDDTSMFHIFERLNTGATALTNQEIRDCVYHGEFSKFLKELNMLENWRTIFGNSAPDSRKRDIELILRFLALRTPGEYKKPMKIFLNDFMKNNVNLPSSELMRIRENFEATCQSVIEHLGERPFHIKTGLNAAVFDSVMVAFSNRLDAVPNDIGGRYAQLIWNESFQQSISSGTTDERVVEARFSAAAMQLFDT